MCLMVSLCFWVTSQDAIAQDSTSGYYHDTSYYETYPHLLTTRLYTVNKFTTLQFLPDHVDKALLNRPNTNFNVGVGATYRGLAINIAFFIPAFNNDPEDYGHSDRFNATANFVKRKFNLTMFFELHRVYYQKIEEPRAFYKVPELPVNIRNDMRSTTMGLSGTVTLNNKKMSFRAAFNQDEWQKKSAGSFLVGGFLTGTFVQADSAIFPFEVPEISEDNQLTGLSFFDIGPQAGYAANVILRKHWFFTASVVIGGGINYIDANYEGTAPSRYDLKWGYRWQFRLGAGYNSKLNYVGVTYVNERNHVDRDQNAVTFDAGNIRLNLVHRFNVRLGLINKIMDAFPNIFQSLPPEHLRN